MDDRLREFLEEHHSAAMVTLGREGAPHVARVGVALVDGKLWSSGTRGRVRTGHLRRDPRSTLFVFDPAWRWIGLEATVTILEGPDAPELNLRLMRTMQGRPTGSVMWMGEEKRDDEFFRLMVEEERLIYEFEIDRAYGLY
jgi:PPOX class probable F420-dependent enzyme